jgi:alkylation response protein AidB-like acyl-CoA dehydrogenase
LLIDMKSPGVEVKPMLTLGHTPAFCDTFFTDVKVPEENLLGTLDEGWTLAKALLGHERTLVGSPGASRRTLRLAKRLAAIQRAQGRSLLDDPAWRRRIADVEIRLRAHELTCYRALAEQQKGKPPGPETSILKVVGSELVQRCDEHCMEIIGLDALSWMNEDASIPAIERWVGPQYCYDRATTIYAGSNEIQRNIIAKLVLGLPQGKA